MTHTQNNSSVSILIGTIIGAGFASGQEIVTFFIRFGQPGLLGLAATGILWIVSFSTLFYVVRKDHIHSYSELADILFGHRIRIIYQILVAVFMFLSLSIMFSGAGTLLNEQWALPRLYGTIGMAAAVYLTLCFGHQGLSMMNQILVPLMIVGILLSSAIVIANPFIPSSMLSLEPIRTLNMYENPIFQVLLHCLLYVSYNMISVTVIFSAIPVSNPRRTALYAGLILTVLSLALGVATFINYGTIIEIEIPVPALLSRFTTMRCMYTLLLLLAMYTTAIGSAYGCLTSMKSTEGFRLLLLIISAVLASGLGFSALIDRGYTLFGYIGFLQLLLLFFRAVYHRRMSGR